MHGASDKKTKRHTRQCTAGQAGRRKHGRTEDGDDGAEVEHVLVDERDEEVLAAQDAAGHVVRRELLLGDGDAVLPRALLLQEARHHLVPLDRRLRVGCVPCVGVGIGSVGGDITKWGALPSRPQSIACSFVGSLTSRTSSSSEMPRRSLYTARISAASFSVMSAQ